MADTSTTEQGEAQSYNDAARQFVKGCSNWSDVQYRIVPRIAILLQERDRAATGMRDLCVEKVRAMRDGWAKREANHLDVHGNCEAADQLADSVRAADQIVIALQSLTLDQVEQKQSS